MNSDFKQKVSPVALFSGISDFRLHLLVKRHSFHADIIPSCKFKSQYFMYSFKIFNKFKNEPQVYISNSLNIELANPTIWLVLM